MKLILAAAGAAMTFTGGALCSASFGLLASCIRPGTLITGMVWSFFGIKLAIAGVACFERLRHPEREPPVRADAQLRLLNPRFNSLLCVCSRGSVER